MNLQEMMNHPLYKIMTEIDKYGDLDNHPIRESDAYKAAASQLGWDIDWDKVAEERLGQSE